MVVRIFRKNKTNMTGVIELIIFIKKTQIRRIRDKLQGIDNITKGARAIFRKV